MNEIDFIADLNKEVSKYGYTIIRKKNRCRDCIFWSGEKTSIGVRCMNPEKFWRSETAAYKAAGDAACKLYKEVANEKESTSISRNST